MATYEELIAKSKELAAAGRMDDAKRVAEIALKTRNATPAAPKGNWFQRNILPDDDDTSLNAGETVAAMLNKAGEGMTLGLIGDEADARVKSWLPGGGTYDEELAKNRAQEQALWDKSPALSMGAELGGAVLPAMLSGGTSLTASGAGLGRKVATSAALGAGAGATYGFMEGEGGFDERRKSGQTGALLGGGVGALAPVIGAGVQKGLDARKQSQFLKRLRETAPTTDALRAEGRALYKQVDDAGVQIKPEAFSRLQGEITDYLRANGLDELPGAGSLTPKAARVVQIGNEMAGQMDDAARAGQNPGLPFSSLDQYRRHAGTAAMNMAPDGATDRALGAMTIEKLDDFVSSLGDRADDVLTGDAAALKTALPKARETWSRMLKSQTLDDAIEQSENYLSGGASGLRNQFAKILRNKKLAARFSDAEKAAMKRVAQGTLPEMLIHNLGSGLTMIAGPVVGGALGSAGGPAGALLGGSLGAAAAAGARRASEKIAMKNADIARALVAKGGVNTLPVASPQTRRIVESLMRRTGAAAGQGL